MTLIRLFLLTSLSFTFVVNSNAQEVSTNTKTPPQNSSAKNNVRVALDDYFRKAAGLGFAGAVLVAKDGEIITRKSYGWADVKRQIPIKPDTVFDIGSGVKAFTATAIMQLEEQGKLNASDPITKYFKYVPADKANITIHQLLTHTSGLNFDYFYDGASPEEREIMKDREKYVKGVLGFPLAFKPGEGRTYSNTGFSLLAIIIEKLSGESYEQYVREHLFKPAGMTETGYYIPRDLRRVARGYNDGDTDYGYPWETQWNRTRPLWDLMGNGGMLTTLDDVYKWMVAIKGSRLVSQKSKDKMFQVYYPKSDQGYGWNVWQTEGKPYVWRGGDAVPQAWNVEFRWYKEDDLIAVILTNKRIRAGSIRRYAMPHLVNIALFNKPPELPAFVSINKKNLRRWEGTYKLDSGAMFHVKTNEAAIGETKPESTLTISGEGQQAIDLLFSANQLPALTKLSLELNDKTKAYIEALRKNDVGALKTILPADSSPEVAVKRWNDFVKQNGELEKLEILGTSSLNQQGVQTFVRLKFKNLGGVYQVTWRDQKIHDQEEARLQPAITAFLRKSFVEFPLNLPFLPQSESDFATYDLFKGRTINVNFTVDGKLVVHTKDGDVVAQKVEKLLPSKSETASIQKIRIPFELNQGRIYVDAFVNERGPFRFMVDTGASGIGRADVRLVKDLGLTVTGTNTNFDGINFATVEAVAINSLRIGQLTRRNVEVLSRDYNTRLLPGAKILLGIIGDEFFSDYLLKIDYIKKEIILSKGSLEASERNVLRYDANRPFVVPLRIGRHNAVGLIDTGSVLEMHLPLEWAEKLKIQNLKDAGEGRRANTVFKLFAAELPVPVEIGGNKIIATEARFSELAKRINIGGSFLTNRTFAF